MLLVNTKDGRTHHYDLREVEQERAWTRDCSASSFQRSITGLGVLWQGRRHSLAPPKGFSRLLFGADLKRDDEGEPILLHAFVMTDTLTVSLRFHLKTATVQVDCERTGNPRWTPIGVPMLR